VTKRLIVTEPHPISEVIGAVTFGTVTFDLKRGLLATLDAARVHIADDFVTAAQALAGLGVVVGSVERLVLAAIQAAWYEETQGKVPASCQKTLALAREAAR